MMRNIFDLGASSGFDTVHSGLWASGPIKFLRQSGQSGDSGISCLITFLILPTFAGTEALIVKSGADPHL